MGKDGGDINMGNVNGNVTIQQAGRDIVINGVSYEIHNELLEKYVVSKYVLKRIAKQCQSAETLEQLVYWILRETESYLTKYDSIQEFIEKLPPEAKANPDIQQLTDKLVEAVDEGHYDKLPDLFAKAIEKMKLALMKESSERYWSPLYYLYTTRANSLKARGQYYQAAVDFHTASELIPQPDKGKENNLDNAKTYTFRKLYSDCLHEAGAALRQAGKYEQAQQCLETALQWREKLHANMLDNTDIANTMNSLAVLYEEQGNYTEALPLFKQALEIHEKVLGKHHPDTANSLNNLAGVYRAQGNYAEALPLVKQALEIREKVLGKQHPDTASSLNNLAMVYKAQGNYAEALRLHKQAVDIARQALGEQHPDYKLYLENYEYVQQEAQTAQTPPPEPAAVSPAPAEPPKTPEPPTPPKTWISYIIETMKGCFSFK